MAKKSKAFLLGELLGGTWHYDDDGRFWEEADGSQRVYKRIGLNDRHFRYFLEGDGLRHPVEPREIVFLRHEAEFL